ncbi:MAG: hypothetical protein AB3N12_04545 [Ruegeria sp.]
MDRLLPDTLDENALMYNFSRDLDEERRKIDIAQVVVANSDGLKAS